MRPSQSSIAALAVFLLGTLSLAARPPAPRAATPPHRRHHALAYDPATKRVVLAGGQHVVSDSETPVLTDLWNWDGTRWTEVSSSTGIPLITHKLFADGAGGLFAMVSRGLAARWDATEWRAIDVDWNARRESAAGAYDVSRRQFVTFGGLVGGRAYDTSSDTWAFDGAMWRRVATRGPVPMLGGAMAYDARRQVVVLFGGLSATGQKLADTWEWNGTAWTRVATRVTPPARFGAGMAYDRQRGETIVFGGVGADDRKLDDTWRFDGRRWSRAQTRSSPAPRSEGYLAYDDARARMVMFGGEGANVVPTLGDTWEWNGTQWTQRH
jgi:hypothetical protein